MKNNLPKVYANTSVSRNINNKESFHFEKEKIKLDIKSNKKDANDDIKSKIKELFNSVNYVYKIDVEIDTGEGFLEKRIVGKNKNNLITIDNELIPIKQIIDIRKK